MNHVGVMLCGYTLGSSLNTRMSSVVTVVTDVTMAYVNVKELFFIWRPYGLDPARVSVTNEQTNTLRTIIKYRCNFMRNYFLSIVIIIIRLDITEH